MITAVWSGAGSLTQSVVWTSRGISVTWELVRNLGVTQRSVGASQVGLVTTCLLIQEM